MKKFLLATLLPLIAFLVLSPALSPNVTAFDPFGGSTCDQTNVEGEESPVCAADGTQNPITGTNGLVTNIANIFALMTGIAAVVMIMVGGFEYVRSGGESSKVNKAKNTILFAIIGLVVVVLARSLILFTLSLL